MPLVVPLGFAQLIFRFQLAGDPEEMITTIGIDITGGPADTQVVADERRDQFLAAISASQMSGAYTFVGVTVRTWDGRVYESLSGRVGTGGGGAQLPQNCAYLLKKVTASAGRRNRGRMYVPVFIGAEGDVDNTGKITESVRLAIQDVFRPAFFKLTDVILHSQAGIGPAPGPPTPITALNLDPVIATQRRRMRR
jgi:hypothetical protein